MSLLILPGVVDPLVLGWNFLTRVGTEIKCAGHEIIIPPRNRHNGWLEEKLSVAVVQQTSEVNGTTTFLETELVDFSTMTGTSNTVEQNIKMKVYKPIKQIYYPNNPKFQGEINAKVDELLQMGFIEQPKTPYNSPIVMEWRLCVDFRQISAPLCACNTSASFGPSNLPQSVSARVRLPGLHNINRTHARCKPEPESEN